MNILNFGSISFLGLPEDLAPKMGNLCGFLDKLGRLNNEELDVVVDLYDLPSSFTQSQLEEAGGGILEGATSIPGRWGEIPGMIEVFRGLYPKEVFDKEMEYSKNSNLTKLLGKRDPTRLVASVTVYTENTRALKFMRHNVLIHELTHGLDVVCLEHMRTVMPEVLKTGKAALNFTDRAKYLEDEKEVLAWYVGKVDFIIGIENLSPEELVSGFQAAKDSNVVGTVGHPEEVRSWFSEITT